MAYSSEVRHIFVALIFGVLSARVVGDDGGAPDTIGLEVDDLNKATVVSWYTKMVIDLLFALIIIGSWRLLCKKECVQQKLHSLPGMLPLLLQWYSFFFVMIFFLFVWCFLSIVFSDYQKEHLLDQGFIEDNFRTALARGDLTEDDVSNLRMDWPLKTLSLVSPLVGLGAFVVLCIHIVLHMKSTMKAHDDAAEGSWAKKYRYSIVGRNDMVLLIIGIPSIFLVMSMRSTARMWMVMRAYDIGTKAKTDLALFDENFQLAEVCQYYVVWMFASLCMDFLVEQKAPKSIKKIISSAGFLGVLGWVVVGGVHSALMFGLTFGKNNGLVNQAIENKMGSAEGKLAFTASVTSLLCAYNMRVVNNMKYMKKALGNPSRKFTGTKILLLVGPNLLKVLLLLCTSDNPILESVVRFVCLDDPTTRGFENVSKLSVYRARLLHSSLMCTLWCPMVVLFNVYSWQYSGEINNGVSLDAEDDLDVKLLS